MTQLLQKIRVRIVLPQAYPSAVAGALFVQTMAAEDGVRSATNLPSFVHAEDFHHRANFPKMPEGVFGGRSLAGLQISIENVLPWTSLHRPGFDLAQ